MEELKRLSTIIQKHAEENNYMMNANDVINFIDHISVAGDDCKKCSEAMKIYTDGEVTKNDLPY